MIPRFRGKLTGAGPADDGVFFQAGEPVDVAAMARHAGVSLRGHPSALGL